MSAIWNAITLFQDLKSCRCVHFLRPLHHGYIYIYIYIRLYVQVKYIIYQFNDVFFSFPLYVAIFVYSCISLNLIIGEVSWHSHIYNGQIRKLIAVLFTRTLVYCMIDYILTLLK